MRHTRSNPLHKIIGLLSAILLVLCILAAVGTFLHASRPEPGTPEYTIWLYAKEHGYSLRDYPESLIDLLKRNPETEQFVLEYPKAKDATQSIDMSAYLGCDSVPLFLQWDPRWGYMPYGSNGTVGSSGCGPTCLSMAVFYLTGNRECTPDVVAHYSLDNGYYIDTVGTAWALLDTYPTEFGVSVSNPSLSDENLKAHLDCGNILICSVRPGDFTSEGHFILIYGYDESGYKINDPKCIYRSRLSWTYEQIQDDIKRIWSVGK